MRTINDLIDYLYCDQSEDTKKFIVEQLVKDPDSNKGFFWEKVLAKAMAGTAILLGKNTKGMDFDDYSDAKFCVFGRKKGSTGMEASISGIRNKVGTLRVCLCVPGQHFHRLMYMLIPHEAYAPYKSGSKALKVSLSPRGNVQGPLSKYVCSFNEVIKKLDCEI